MTYGLKNSINLKKGNKIATLSLASLLAINGCGGDSGGGGGGTTVESENISFSLKSNNPIAGTVEIRSAKGDVLLTGLQSDNSGNIQIKQDEFNSMLNQYSLDNSDFIEVYTIDQGTVNSYSQSYSSMNMSVSALLKSSDLDRAVIGPVSKFVHNLILQHENYNSDISSAEIQNIIDETLKKVALSDINHDGIINNSDVINYDMSAFESGLETVLRDSGYLDLLENGNENEIAEKQEIIMQLQENLSVTNHESEYNGTANGENGTGETYIPVELETIKTELEGTLSASLAELNQLDNQLSTTQSQQNQLSNEIENQKNSISQHSNNLNNLADFERKISNIDFRNDSDSTLKSKIDTLPNIQQISRNIAPMMARTVSTQSDMVFLSAAPYSDSEKLPQLQERKNQLKSEILEVLRKIQDINQSISEKQNDISRKNTEIQNEESVLIENQRIVDEYQQKIVEFQNRNKTQIDNYQDALKKYTSNVNILKREGRAKNLWLDIGDMTENVGDADFTWSAVQRRADSITKPNKFSYTTDRNSKNYSDLFPFEETIVDYFGTKLVAKMHYGNESDYPAIMEIYKNGSYLGKNTGIRNESHKSDLKKYYGAHVEKSLVEGILQEMITQENLVDSYAYIIYDLAKVELDWVNKKDEFRALKNSIQPKIDALQSLKRDLERAKNILENEKQEKRNLEELKKELVGKLTILQGQINELSTTKITIENILNNLEEDLKNKEEDYEINQQNLVEINDNKNSIEITITTTEKDLEELNNQINQTSDKWKKYSFKEIIWGKVFEFEVISSVEGGETKEVMQQKGIEKFEEIKKNIISNEFYFSDGNSYVVYSYFPQGKGNFPAYIWGSYNLYGKSRTTESYLVNSQDQIDLLGNSLKSTVEKNVIQNAFNSEKIDINDGLHDGLSSYPRVHYYNNNSNEKFPATVSLELKLGNYSFYKHNPKLLYSQEDIDNEIGEMNANVSPYKSETKVNAGKPIWIVDKLTPMVGGAYHIYEFDGKYIATWKVANKGTWKFGGLRDNPYELEDELIRILDDWQYRNSTEPTSIDEDRSPAEMKPYIENNTTSIHEAVKVIKQIEQNIFLNNSNFSLIPEQPIESINLTNLSFYKLSIDSSDEHKIKKWIYNQVLNYFHNKIENIKLALSTSVVTAKFISGFTVGFYKGIENTLSYILSLNMSQIFNILPNLIQSIENTADYAGSIPLYWTASMHHMLSNSQESLNKKLEYLEKVSLDEEYKELEEILTQVDWDKVDNKSYRLGFFGGYISQKGVEAYSVGRALKGLGKQSLIKIKKFSEDLVKGTAIIKNLAQLNLSNKFTFNPAFIEGYSDEVIDVFKSYENRKYIDSVDEAFLNSMGIVGFATIGNQSLANHRGVLYKGYKDLIIKRPGNTLEKLSTTTGLNLEIIKKLKTINGGKTFLGYIVNKLEKGKKLTEYDELNLEILNAMPSDKLSTIHGHHFLTNKKGGAGNSEFFQDEIKKIGLDLEGDWNIGFVINHRGSHGNAYTDRMIEEFDKILSQSGGNKDTFVNLFEELKIKVIETPDKYRLNIDYHLNN